MSEQISEIDLFLVATKQHYDKTGSTTMTALQAIKTVLPLISEYTHRAAAEDVDLEQGRVMADFSPTEAAEYWLTNRADNIKAGANR